MSTSIPTSTLEKFTTFGDLLRYLRRASGLTQLELSVQVGYSHAQISRLEQNLRLPDIPTIEARFVPALDVQEQPNVVARLLELAANVRREDAPGLGLCPYKGLNYFDESDADLFVGREILTANLAERVISLSSGALFGKPRFLAVVGASGSGKSSLVRAGLIPALRWNKDSADWQIYVLSPTVHPLESLASVLTNESESVLATSTLMDDLSHDPRSLQIFIHRQRIAKERGCVLLVIDQFEETFALCRSEQERASFIESLLAAASEPDGPVNVLITLRADFYGHCATYFQLREALAQNQEYIGAMSDAELRRAIEEPARRGRWELEPGLVDVLLHDVGHEPGALPLLSHALFEIWQRRRGRMMTLSGYASSGGVRGAIAETAETVFSDQFTSEQRSIAKRIFLRLTELGAENTTADTRRRASFTELILRPEDASMTRTVLKALADARLIITGEETAEVAHEALIREWPTLQGWLEENRESLRLHRQLTETAQGWLAFEREPDLLYRGARLAQVREWSFSHGEEMNALEHEFLAASIAASEWEIAERESQRQRELEAAQQLAEEQRRRAEAETRRAEVEGQRVQEQLRTVDQLRKRALLLAGALTLALIMALTALFFSAQSRQAARSARTQQQIATSRELALASLTNLEVDPERSVLLALNALETAYTLEAEDALHRAVQTSRLQLVISAHEPGAPMMVALSPRGSQFATGSADGSLKTWDLATGKQLLEVEGFFAAYSPDGRRLVISLPNETVRVIDPATGEEVPLSGQVDSNFAMAFSPDGSKLATVTSNNTPKIWSSTTGQELVAFPGHRDLISSIVFSPDGTRLLTASDDHTARVWDTGTGEQILNLSEHPSWVLGAKYSPDGGQIATLSGNEAYLWDSISGKRLLTFSGHKNTVFTLAFSPDGTRLATAGLDRKIILWDVKTGRELFRLAGHAGAVVEVAFTPDGQSLLSSSDDGTVRLWDVRPGRELMTITTENASGQLSFNNESTHIVTTDDTGDIRVWEIHSGNEMADWSGPGQRGSDIAWDPKGNRIFIADQAGKVRMLDSRTGAEQAAVSAHTAEISRMTVSLDGNLLATASQDYTAKVWDISSHTLANEPLLNVKSPGTVFSVAFDAQGKRLAIGEQEGNTSIWDLATGKELQVLRGHLDHVTAIAFDPTGTRLATSSWDGTARVWDLAAGSVLFTLGNHTGAVTSLAYSPDGRRVATASEDGTAKLWDAASGEELLTFLGDGSALYDIAFSPDGKLLATGSQGEVRLYLLEVDDLIALAETRLTRHLTPEECQKYLHLAAPACEPAITIPTTTPLPPTDQGRICQVTNTAGLYDRSFNETIYEGLQNTRAEFGWDAKVLQSASNADFAKNIGEFLRGDCDLLVGLFSMADALRVAAESNPRQKFWIEYRYEQEFENVWMQQYATDQAAFLAGYAAASVTKTGKVGVFGGVGIPSVTDFMDGFALGIDEYNQANGTEVELVGWNMETRDGLFVGGFCCAAEGREITQRLLAQGVDIVLPVAGTDVGAGALYAVKAHGSAYVIGVDTDWAVTNPEYADVILTSVVKNFDVSIVQSVKAIQAGTFAGGVHVGTLETDEVGLAPFYKLDFLFSDTVKADLEQVRNNIIAGISQTKP